MRNLLIGALLTASAFGQVYPGAVATDANLPRLRNTPQTTLNGTINASTGTVVLTSGTGFTSNMVITIGSERLKCGTLSTNTYSGCTRGYDSSSAASHSSGATVRGLFVAANLNNALDEIKAIQTALGANLSNVAQLSNNLSDLPAVSTARINLGLEIGADVQAYDADLQAFAALSCTDGQIPKKASGVWTCAADGGGSGAGDVVGPASATDSCFALYDGTTGKLLKDSTLCSDPTKNSGQSFEGSTSGELAFTVANIAGTATTLIWPTDSSTATDGYALVLGSTTTCPTNIPTGLPATCRSLSWSAVASSGGGGISASLTIDFPSLGDGQCSDQTGTLTGLAAGDQLSLGLPASINAGFVFTAVASATDTAKVRACNLSGGTVDLASASFGVQRPTAISASSTINFSAIADGACSTSTFILTGAASGGRITPGFPAALESGLVGRMHVSAADTVTVQLCNYSGASLDPASGTFSASIL